MKSSSISMVILTPFSCLLKIPVNRIISNASHPGERNAEQAKEHADTANEGTEEDDRWYIDECRHVEESFREGWQGGTKVS